jgi:hypothetical protein
MLESLANSRKINVLEYRFDMLKSVLKDFRKSQYLGHLSIIDKLIDTLISALEFPDKALELVKEMEGKSREEIEKALEELAKETFTFLMTVEAVQQTDTRLKV